MSASVSMPELRAFVESAPVRVIAKPFVRKELQDALDAVRGRGPADDPMTTRAGE